MCNVCFKLNADSFFMYDGRLASPENRLNKISHSINQQNVHFLRTHMSLLRVWHHC